MNGYITLALIAVTALVSWQAWERPRLFDRLILWPPAIERQQQYDRLLTHGFIHADGMHLIFNMVTLYSFGQAMERYFSDRIGPVGYLLFYLSAIVIALGQVAGPMVAGVLADLTGNYRLGFTVLALVAGTGSVLFMLASKPELP